MKRIDFAGLGMAVGFLVWMGCSTTPDQASNREAKARYEYNRIMREYRVPAEEATNEVERVAMLDQVAAAYLEFTQEYGDVPRWSAAALRSLGQVHLERGEFKEALASFEQVGQRYPQEHWEVIQAWKEAADMLWETRHRGEAVLYYRQMVDTYDRPGQPPMFETLVNIARLRLNEQGAR